jgi:hypothetical protein
MELRNYLLVGLGNLSGLPRNRSKTPSSGPLWRGQRLVNRPDTALHIAVLRHGLYAGAIPIWGGLVRPNSRAP